MVAVLSDPRFCNGQHVTFLGGEGVIKRFSLDASGWNYLVEMTLGDEPDFGRIGAETMILLHEADIRF